VNRATTTVRNTWPDAGEAGALFGRLIAGDPLAPSRCAEAFLEPLIAFLRTIHRHVDDHIRQDAAERAIISLCKRPSQFDPVRGDLVAYLMMSATADLRNLLMSENRHHQRRENWDSVELDGASGNSDDELEEPDLPSFDHPSLAAVIRDFSTAERVVFELMKDGERSTAAFAAALGLTDGTADDRESVVKRVKDRIKQRLKRAVEGS
jgi:DNA-directed RNA polymerase specialized sigma24 family protein